jgi:hypothetical protein
MPSYSDNEKKQMNRLACPEDFYSRMGFVTYNSTITYVDTEEMIIDCHPLRRVWYAPWKYKPKYKQIIVNKNMKSSSTFHSKMKRFHQDYLGKLYREEILNKKNKRKKSNGKKKKNDDRDESYSSSLSE